MKIGLFELAKVGFYIESKKEFRELVKQRIYEKFKTLKQFASQTNLKINISSILGERYTTISTWLKICKSLDINQNKFKQSISKIRTKKKENFIKPEILPILSSPELASLVGHSLGDGHLSRKDKCFEYTNKEISLHNHILKTIRKVFGFNRYNKKLDNKNIQTNRYSKLIGSILYLSGVPLGNKITQPSLVPEWVMHGSKEIKVSFIKALFDDEGTVKVNNKELLIKFSKNDRYIASLQKFMEQIKQLLEDLGIEVTSIRKGNLWSGKNGNTIQLILGIHGYENFIRFSKEIEFNHKQKQEELKRMISSYISFQHKKGRIQDTLYKNLYKPQTIYDLMNKLNISYMTVYKNFKKLEKKDLIKKVGYNKNRHILWRRVE